MFPALLSRVLLTRFVAQNDREPADIVAVKLGRGEGKDMLQREAKILYQLRGYGTAAAPFVAHILQMACPK